MKNYKKQVLWLIGLSILIKLFVAGMVELGNDEVYYWTYAQKLQWNYFDHPPLVALCIRITTLNLWLDNEIFIRLSALLASAGGTWLIYRITSMIKNEKAGWYAALLFTGSIYSSVIAGLFILPDSPQAFFWFWAVYLLVQIVRNKEENQNNTRWLLFGLASGLCILCKVHGVFLWFGPVLYALIFSRKWFSNPWIYLGGFITLIIISPIIVWNIQNHFITYTYHSERVSLNHSHLNFLSFGREIFGQFFYNNPINFFLVWMSLIALFKNKIYLKQDTTRLLLCCFLPLILVLLFVSLFRDTLPHWSGPAYSGLLILTALYLTDIRKAEKKPTPNILKYSLAFILFIMLAGVIVINYYPGTLSGNKENKGSGDFTLDMYGWKDFGKEMKFFFQKDRQYNRMPEGSRIIVSKWFPAAHLELYAAKPAGLQTYAIGNIFDLHQYIWSNKYKLPLKAGDCAYYIQSSNNFQSEYPEQYKALFKQIEKPVEIKQFRNQKYCRSFFIYRMKGFIPGQLK